MSRDLRRWSGLFLAVILATLLGIAAAAGSALAAAVPQLTYVVEGSQGLSTVWSANLEGSQARALGPGTGPLLAPDGETVAASLSGSRAGTVTGPKVALYSTDGGASRTYLNLPSVNVEPLAWSADSRYLAIQVESGALRNIAAHSTLDVLDTSTGTIATVAHGQIYGASFAPDGSDRLAYARANSLSLSAAVNVFTSMPDGSDSVQLTGDGRSLNPVWGTRYLAYDRQRLRKNAAPVMQIWLRVMRPGGTLRRITNLRVSPLVSGLLPIAFSAGGTHLLAEFEGEDTSEAWVLGTSGGAPRRLTSHGNSVLGAGISADGSRVLIDEDSFEQPPASGRIATLPFVGGRATVLVGHGVQASWNG